MLPCVLSVSPKVTAALVLVTRLKLSVGPETVFKAVLPITEPATDLIYLA